MYKKIHKKIYLNYNNLSIFFYLIKATQIASLSFYSSSQLLIISVKVLTKLSSSVR